MRVYRGLTARLPAPCALTIGNFDGVHCGHQAMLARLKAEAAARGLPTTVLTFEPHPREFFAPQSAPTRLTSLREKLEAMENQGIDQVVVLPFNRQFASLTPDAFIDEILIERLRARFLLIGDDFCFGAGRKGDFATLQAAVPRAGFELAEMHTLEGAGARASRTAVRDALASGNMEAAAALLGRTYSISGRVIHGNKLGRTIGFPTANIQLKHNRPPVWGIFAVTVDGIAEKPLAGAASLGRRPTVTDDGRATLEVFVFDFQGDLYGRHLRVNFHHKLRDEAKFATLDELTTQINRDVAEARAFYVAHPEFLVGPDPLSVPAGCNTSAPKS